MDAKCLLTASFDSNGFKRLVFASLFVVYIFVRDLYRII